MMSFVRSAEPRVICIITSGHISYNPRTVKEADALAEAGYDVRVVSVNVDARRWELDCRLMTGRSWQLTPLHVGRELWFLAGMRQKLLSRSPRLWVRGSEDWAFSRYHRQLAKLAVRRPADLFIAHNLQALPAAFRASRIQRAKVGFDAEDFHRGELPATPATGLARKLVAKIEEKFIPHCDYVSAASSGIAQAYAHSLHIPTPHVILNAFPLSEREGVTPASELAQERKGDGISLYWYSQVIGPERGLTDAVNALGLLRGQIHLHLRGEWANGYKQKLLGLASRLGVEKFIHILPSAPPEQLVERSAQHDIGLAAEMGQTPNNKIAVSNKLLNYMLAGLAIAATDVPGQQDVMTTCPDAGFLYASGDAQALADGLKVFLENPAVMHRAKAAARRCGETRYCWDLEKLKLLDAIAGLFSSLMP